MSGVVITVVAGLSTTISSATVASLASRHSFGTVGARFVVSFGAPVEKTNPGALVTEGDWKLQMKPRAIGYVAALGGNSYEEADVAIYPRAPSPVNVTRYLNWNAGPSGKLREWHGFPGAYLDVACREGDSPILCPGRIAYLWIVRGRVVYELVAEQVTQAEVEQFFGSFRPTT